MTWFSLKFTFYLFDYIKFSFLGSFYTLKRFLIAVENNECNFLEKLSKLQNTRHTSREAQTRDIYYYQASTSS